MSACVGCGTPLGLGNVGPCANCEARVRDRQAAASERIKQENRSAWDQYLQQYVDWLKSRIDAVIEVGGTAYLYNSVYVEVDSQLESMDAPAGLDLNPIALLGADGWETVGVLPRSYSGSQSYFARSRMTSRDWGGQKLEQRIALSGNLIGSYVMLRLPITRATRLHYDAVIMDSCRSHVEAQIGNRP